MADALVVTGLARLGDGIAQGDNGRVLVRGALPGDTVTGLVLEGVIDAPHFIARGRMHATPPCADFGTCGGCQLQHMTHDAYVAWKRQRVVDALAAQRIEADVAPLTVCEPRSRRRAGFSIRHIANGVELGFQEARSHTVVAFEECHVVLPVLNKARGALAALAKAALPMMAADAKPATASVTVTKSGLDVALSDVERLNADRREAALKIA
ncbi:MAG: RNA methyltransferase, partial [Pseudomonadota bacterium]